MSDADAELAARCAKGDMTALDALYRRYADRVWRYAWSRTRSRDAAADIVQEAFLRVAHSVARFQGRSTFATWLFAVTRSVVVERQRREGRANRESCGSVVLHLVNGEEDDPPGALEREENQEAVRRAVARLPAAQGDAVALCDLSGLTVRQAAEVLKWSESRVKVTLFRARRRLREILQDYISGASAAHYR